LLLHAPKGTYQGFSLVIDMRYNFSACSAVV
jgi:hypothetical protein